MSKTLHRFMLGLLCTQLITYHVYSQDFALSKSKISDSIQKSQSEQMALSVLLTELEEKFQISFNYKVSSVKNKYVKKSDYLIETDRLEENLKEILKPLQLSIEKVGQDNYVILEIKQEEKQTIKKIKSSAGTSSYGNAWQNAPTLLTANKLQISSSKQNLVVSGRITGSDDNEGVIGVNVVLKGTSLGTITDANGRFSLSLPSGDGILVFSYIGYKTQEVAINNRSMIDVVMAVDMTQLEEVVVVGYGTEERRNITSSISSVKGKDIENLPAASVESLFQGRAPGVQVVQNSGTPGGGISVRIRGSSSINADNEPLYVLDGVPMNSGNFSKLDQDLGSGGANVLADINPNDIESIEFLKDAASASVYGARAANGVVLITTKRGKMEQTSFNFSMYHGIQQKWRTLNLLSSQEQAELAREASFFAGQGANEVISSGAVETDWLDEIFRTAPISNYDFSIRGGEKKIKYALSMGYFDQEGIMIATSFKRYSTRLNLDYQLSKRISIGTSLMLSRSDRDRSDAGNTNQGVLSNAVRKLPSVPVYDIFGNYVLGDPIGRLNPVAIANEVTFRTINDRAVGSIFGIVEILPGLTFKSSYGIDYISVKDNRFYPNTAEQNSNRSAFNGMNQNFTWLNENILTYSKSFEGRHNLTVLAGHSVQESLIEGIGITTIGAPTNAITYATSVLQNGGATGSSWGLSSLFGRASYDYSGKYLLAASFRRDGSSRFGKDNRFGFFPSASAGWRVSAEPFMQNISFLNDFKIRGSIGSVGNQNGIGDFTHRGLYLSGNNYLGRNGLFPDEIPNSNLRWETTVQSNLGIDVSILNNRVQFIADVYYKKTNDLLVRVDIPSTTGFPNTLVNIGNVENKGLEMSLITENLTGAFKWSTSFNIGFNENKILKLENDSLDITSSLGASLGSSNGIVGRARVGEPIGSFFGHKFLGVYATDADNEMGLRQGGPEGYIFRGGDAIFADIDGNGYIDADDIVNIGRGFPIMQGGIINDFSYGNWSLNVFLQYSYGNEIFNQTRAITDNMTNNRASKHVLRRWRQPGDITDVPRAIAGSDPAGNARSSSRWVEDGSYLRVKTVTLAYDLPYAAIERFRIRNLKLYATAQNLFTFTRYTGFDPEVNFSSNPLLFGIDLGTYPQARSIIFGLNVGF